MKRIAEDDPSAIPEINPLIPLWLVCVVNRLLVKCPKQRLNSAAETSYLFSQCLQHLQNSSNSPLPPVVVTWMNNGANSRVALVGDNPIATSMRFMLAKRTRMTVNRMRLAILGECYLREAIFSRPGFTKNDIICLDLNRAVCIAEPGK